MSKGQKSGSQGGKDKRGEDGKKDTPKGKGKPERGKASARLTAKEARERAARIIPSENFKVIAEDPLKAQIVAVALQRLYSPSEYSRESGVELNIASYAFKVLWEKGILELVKEEKVRGATIKHMYRATEAAIVSDADWGELAEALRPLFTGTILQDFSARVAQAIETGHLYSLDDFCLYWAPRDLDEIAWREQVEINHWCIEESERLEVDTVNRRANGESKGGIHTTFAIASFPSPTHDEFKKHQAKAKRKAPKAKAKGSPVKAKGKGKGGAKAKAKPKGAKSTKGAAKRKGGKA